MGAIFRRNVYFRRIVDDCFRHWRMFLASAVIAVVVFVLFAVVRQDHAAAAAEEQEAYETAIADYDEGIADVEAAILEADAQIESLQTYVDQSVYMRLNSDQIYVAAVNYALFPNDGVNASNVLNSLNLYIKETGLIEDAMSSVPELEPNYWRDIISVGISANNLNITVMRENAEKAKAVLSSIKDLLEKELPAITAAQGAFQLKEIDTAYYTKSDAAVANAQNGHRGNLRSYLTSRADLVSKLNNLKTTRDNYEENNKPNSPGKAGSMKKAILIYGFMGIIIGIGLPFSFLLLKDVMETRVKDEHMVEELGLPMAARYNGVDFGGMDADRIALEITAAESDAEKKKAYLQLFEDDSRSKQAAELLQEALKKRGWEAAVHYGECNTVQELEELLDTGCVIAIMKKKVTAVDRVERYIKQLSRLRIHAAESVLVE